MFLKKYLFTITVLSLLLISILPVFAETAKDLKVKGDEYLNKEDLAKALECYEQSLVLDPCYARSMFKIAFVYNIQKDYQKAFDYLDKVLDLIKSKKDTSGLLDADVYAEKGYSALGMKKYEDAVTFYDKAIEGDPNWAYPLVWKGIALYSLGKYDDVIDCCDKALKLEPDNQDAKDLKSDATKAKSGGK